jgi:uncharacterized protein (DUF608 family)
MSQKRSYNDKYTGEHLDHLAFPLGGIGAGMICLEGTGALSHFSLRGHPEIYNEPLVFAALCVKGPRNTARVLEGPVPSWKAFFPWGREHAGAGSGGRDKSYGLPRFAQADFVARFPFGTVNLQDADIPIDVELVGWSPFVPGEADASSLPMAAIEYRFVSRAKEPIEAVYSFHARNFMAVQDPRVQADGSSVETLSGERGFVLQQTGTQERPWDEGAFSACIDDPATHVSCAWFRGGWFDALTMVWNAVQSGQVLRAGPIRDGRPSPGGSLFLPFRLEPGEEKRVTLRLGWYVPQTDLHIGPEAPGGQLDCGCGDPSRPRHAPWYSSVFGDIHQVMDHWQRNYAGLREESQAFSDCFYDTSLPPEIVEAVAANLTILKSPTVLRQTDGRLWAWEGCCDDAGCCHGSCTHVWNYAQALPHLFPELERTLRQTEFNENQDERGHQAFRATLPIRPAAHNFHAAADGQLGGIMKVYREWRISGDLAWLRELWPKVKQSLDYCISTWDPAHRGLLEEPHHNTYDIEFWGPDGMCTSFYLGALEVAIAMAEAVGEPIPLYRELLDKGRAAMESELWNGEYFVQRVRWKDLQAGNPAEQPAWNVEYSPEALALLEREGPKYQYGDGCLSDGVLGAWIAAVCGTGEFLDREKVRSHLLAVYRNNLKSDLSTHANPQRPTYALGNEGGLLLCTWPRGGALSLPFVYSDEVWTGIEYQVASHLAMLGHVDECLTIVRALRDRYDGRVRNPFNEYECGHWYARAMASYGILQGVTGVRYDAVERILYLQPNLSGDFRAFLCTATGFGTVGIRDGEPFVEIKSGRIPYERIIFEPA